MNEFRVERMTCGHCARTISEAIRAVDPEAEIQVDLRSRKVRVESAASRSALAVAINEAGYPTA